MATLYINGLQFNFDKMIDFEQDGTNLLVCFFFKNNELITSQFLTHFEVNQLRNKLNKTKN
jgi:hypothetical protein